LATILNDVVAFTVGDAFLNLHCLFAFKAAQQINQRAFIVVQMKSFRHFFPIRAISSLSFALRLRPIAILAKIGEPRP
jgi:hypothetical protein